MRPLSRHEPETVQVRLRIKGTTIIEVNDDVADKRCSPGSDRNNIHACQHPKD
jgi:hypothetical protein